MADFVVTPANVFQGNKATIRRGIAGATIVQGDLLCLNTNTNTLVLFDANNTTYPFYQVFEGIALGSVVAGQPVLYDISDPYFTPGFALAANAVVIGSVNPGKMCPLADLATGSKLTIIGVGVGGNKLKIAPLSSGVNTP